MEESFAWETTAPESERMSTSRLDAMREELSSRGTEALLIVRNDRIVYEWYAPDHGPEKKHYAASLDKAVVGGTSLMLALNDGLIAVDDPASKYVPAWKDDPAKASITVRHLATHCSGVENASEKRELGGGRTKAQNLKELPGWKGAFWRHEPNPFTIARDEAPVIFAPGSEYAYSNTGMAMLAYAVTAALKGSTHEDIRTLLRERIMQPIGVANDEWSIGYGKTFETDGLPLVANWGGGAHTARAVARVGRLMLRRGNWEGKQLVDPAWVDAVTGYGGTPVPANPRNEPGSSPGLGWWTNASGAFLPLPVDAYWGHGAGNQILLVVAMLDLIVVRFGSQFADALAGGAHDFIFTPIMEASSSR